MKTGITVYAEYNSAWSFDNGWTVAVTTLACGHYEMCIVPRALYENKAHGEKTMHDDPIYWGENAMVKRGDLIKHFEGTDDELIAAITGVSLRQPEPSFAKAGQDIMKAVKS